MSEIADAVLISGPRRGEILTIDVEREQPISEDDLSLLVNALDELDQALVRLLESAKRLEDTARRFAEAA